MNTRRFPLNENLFRLVRCSSVVVLADFRTRVRQQAGRYRWTFGLLCVCYWFDVRLDYGDSFSNEQIQ